MAARVSIRPSSSGRRGLALGFLLVTVVIVVAFVTAPWSPQAAAVSDPVFSDVSASSPFFKAIDTLSREGIISGYADGTFRPRGPVLRAQFAKMICGTLELPVHEGLVPQFKDLRGDDPNGLYPHDYVAAAAGAGIIFGYEDNTFRPYTDINRAQVISMVVRGIENLHPTLLKTPPASFSPSWSPGSLAPHGANTTIAEYNGLLSGLGPKGLDPWGVMPRQEVAQVLANALDLLKASSPTPTTQPTTPTTSPPTTQPTTPPPPQPPQPGKDLLHFYWTPQHDWRVFNISDHTGMRVKPIVPVAWFEPAPSTVGLSHLLAVSPAGHLLHFSSPSVWPTDWAVEDVTTATGEDVVDVLTRWSTPADPGLHVLAVDGRGYLAHFVRYGDGHWEKLDDLPELVGLAAAAWRDPSPSSVDHILVMQPVGDLTHLWSDTPGKWESFVVNESFPFPRPSFDVGPGVVHWEGDWLGPPVDRRQIVAAVQGKDGHLYRLAEKSPTKWEMTQLSSGTGPLDGALRLSLMRGSRPMVIAGYRSSSENRTFPMLYHGDLSGGYRQVGSLQFNRQHPLSAGLAAYRTPGPAPSDPWVLHVVAADETGDLLVYWAGEASPEWAVVNVSQLTGQRVQLGVEAWISGLGSPGQVDNLVTFASEQ